MNFVLYIRSRVHYWNIVRYTRTHTWTNTQSHTHSLTHNLNTYVRARARSLINRIQHSSDEEKKERFIVLVVYMWARIARWTEKDTHSYTHIYREGEMVFFIITINARKWDKPFCCEFRFAWTNAYVGACCVYMLISACMGLLHYIHRARTHAHTHNHTANAEYIHAVRSMYTKTCTLNSIVECIYSWTRDWVYTKHKTAWIAIRMTRPTNNTHTSKPPAHTKPTTVCGKSVSTWEFEYAMPYNHTYAHTHVYTHKFQCRFIQNNFNTTSYSIASDRFIMCTHIQQQQ